MSFHKLAKVSAVLKYGITSRYTNKLNTAPIEAFKITNNKTDNYQNTINMENSNDVQNTTNVGNGVLADAGRSFSWETKELPHPQSMEDECNDYYLVKVKGYAKPIMAMYMKDDDGNEGWYVNYFSKIVKEVTAWANVS